MRSWEDDFSNPPSMHCRNMGSSEKKLEKWDWRARMHKRGGLASTIPRLPQCPACQRKQGWGHSRQDRDSWNTQTWAVTQSHHLPAGGLGARYLACPSVHPSPVRQNHYQGLSQSACSEMTMNNEHKVPKRSARTPRCLTKRVLQLSQGLTLLSKTLGWACCRIHNSSGIREVTQSVYTQQNTDTPL